MIDAKQLFYGKRVTVFGLGLHGGGVGTVQFLFRSGARITVTDIKTKEQLAPSLQKLSGLKGITYVLGQHREEDFTRADRIIISPAIPWVNPYVKRALDRGIPVDMDSSIFFTLCPNKIIGVTGTKGKTTTATFIHTILRKSGIDAVLVGVGQIPVLPMLENIKKNTVVIFELSSWRLSALKRIRKSPCIGVFKNFLPDHLNYYRTMDQYFDDKSAIYRFQSKSDWMVINGEDEKLRSIEESIPSRIFSFSWKDVGKKDSVFVREGVITLREQGLETTLIPLEKVSLRGRHTNINLLAAIGALRAFGIPISKIYKGIGACKDIPHRLEFVRDVMGVRYYNDTAATIPEATISAVESFTQPIILIAGGSHKGLLYREFVEQVSHRVKQLILLKGDASDSIQKALKSFLGDKYREEEYFIADSMKQAIRHAQSMATSGDVVLLSPAAASFGMFRDEFDRGNQFIQEVKNL